jgi:pyridoxine kinase
MAVLSIQSRVTSGYVGNAAAVPILQRLGHEVWPIDTVVFSNHPAHGAFSGGVRPAGEVSALADGLEARGLFADCDAVLTGYLGGASTGPAVRDIAARVRCGNPRAVWCCDPVMGDHGRFYVADGIPEYFLDHALGEADIVTPNVFEAGFLSGMEIRSTEEAVRAARLLREKGPRSVVVTGIRLGDSISAVAVADDGVWRAQAPFVVTPAHGAGDAFTALFLGHLLDSGATGHALSLAVSGVHALLSISLARGALDLCLVEALDRLAKPDNSVAVERLG